MGIRGVGGGQRLPDRSGIGRVQVGGGQHRDGPGGYLELALGLDAPADVPVAAARGQHGTAGQDAEAGPGQHGLDPVGPHPVLGHVAQVDLCGGDRLPAGKGVLVLQPEVLGYRPHAGDLPVGDGVGDPLERGQQGCGRPRVVPERGQGLLEGIERLVRHLHRGPVHGRGLRCHPGREALELHPGQGPADVEFLLFAVLYAHRDRQHPDVPVPVPPADLAGYARRTLDALITEGEADSQDVGEFDGADVGDVAQPGAAVDQHVVILLLHVLAHGAEKPAAAEAVVEIVPIERAHRGGIVTILAASGEKVELAAVGKSPLQRDRVPLDLCEFQMPVIAAGPRINGGRRVVIDYLNHARSSTNR